MAVRWSPDGEGKRRLWLAPIDRRSPPRQIPNVEGRTPLFGRDGEIFFNFDDFSEGRANWRTFAYRVKQDGTEIRRVFDRPIAGLRNVSPDGRWLVLAMERVTWAVPVPGGPPVRLYRSDGRVAWSRNQKFVSLSVGPSVVSMGMQSNTYILPLSRGQMLPTVPPRGFQSEAELAGVPGMLEVNSPDVVPGPNLQQYAFTRETLQRNLYRIPVP